MPNSQLLEILFKLVPGLLAAAVFHGLTPYPKRDALDRIAMALIFTIIAQLLVAPVRSILILAGTRFGSIGEWSLNVELAWGCGLGVFVGLLWAHAINRGYVFSTLTKLGLTKKTSLPTQWFSAFSKWDRYVIIHFRNGRRLMGWPREWPDEPGQGHFLLEGPSWILDDGTERNEPRIEVLLIAADEVEAVEFLWFDDMLESDLQKRGRVADSDTTGEGSNHGKPTGTSERPQ